jgi:hypothetical protein
MKTLLLLFSLMAAGCAGGTLVYTEPGGNVHSMHVQDAELSAGGTIQYQDDAGQWWPVRATRAEYKGWCGGCCNKMK